MKAERFTAVMFLAVIMLMMCAVFGSFTVNAAMKLLNRESSGVHISVDWEKLYPFTDGREQNIASEKESLAEYLRQKFGDYTSKYLPGYYRMTEAAKKYESLIGWNMTSVYEYNPVMILEGGYLAPFVESRDITEHAESTVSLAEFCAGLGIDFFYVNEPGKICASEDSNISGILDFSNQNADRFLAKLKEAGVKYYDLRRITHDGGGGGV